MAVKKTTKTLPDSYFDLVKQFPLIHIRDGDHLGVALETIERLLEMNLDDGEQEYVDALTDLIEIYEDQHEPIPDASESDVLRELIRASGLSQLRLAKKVGVSQSTISAVLNGTRSLTKDQVVVLAKYFHISPGAFLRV